MLIIRQEQLSLFNNYHTEQWIERTLYLVRRHWPTVYAEAGDTAMRARIRKALFAARGHGITASDDVRRYLNLTLLLGDDFSTGGRNAWATDILSNPQLPGRVKTVFLMDAVRSMIERATA